jgi:hypothetical protein
LISQSRGLGDVYKRQQISCTYENLKEMCKYLFHAKYFGSKEVPDDIFLKEVCGVLFQYKKIIADALADNEEISSNNKLVNTNNLNIIEWQGKLYFIQDSKAYQVKKDGSKGRLYGTYVNSQIIKHQPKLKEIDI